MTTEVNSSMQQATKRTHDDAGLVGSSEDGKDQDESLLLEPPTKVLVSESNGSIDVSDGDSKSNPTIDSNKLPPKPSPIESADSDKPNLENVTQSSAANHTTSETNINQIVIKSADKTDSIPLEDSSSKDIDKSLNVKQNVPSDKASAISTIKGTETDKNEVASETTSASKSELNSEENNCSDISKTPLPTTEISVHKVTSDTIESKEKETALDSTIKGESSAFPKNDEKLSEEPKDTDQNRSNEPVMEGSKDISTLTTKPSDPNCKDNLKETDQSGTETALGVNGEETGKTQKPFLEPKAPIQPEKSSKPPPTVQSRHSASEGKGKVNSNESKNKKSSKDVKQKTHTPGKRTPEQILKHMEVTFHKRRNFITNEIPTIPILKDKYPDLFNGKQLLIEFQRITKIDIDQKIQEFCVRFATAVIEMAKSMKDSAPVLARWDQAKQENDTLKQYWDMVTAICLLPLHFGEQFDEMVREIGEDEEVNPIGQLEPILIARGNIFRTDEFFLIAENSIVQEFEEFTIAFASLYSSYWVFNMEYPAAIENTYNYIQRCIVRQREPGTVPQVCKNFTKSLQKWNKAKENK